MQERLKSLTYKTAMLPVALYGVECWPITKMAEQLSSIVKMRTLGIKQLGNKSGLLRTPKRCMSSD